MSILSANHVPTNRVPGFKAKSRRKQPTKTANNAKLQVRIWSSRYVAGAVVLSACLNAYASVLHAGGGLLVSSAAAIVGASIPLGVWILAKVSGHLHRATMPRLSITVAGVGCFLLMLSLWHVATSIGVLTGSPLLLSVLLAVGIDCGLVVSEVSSILVEV